MTPKAVALLERILDDATVDLKFRIRAAETVLDRVLGPVGRGGEVVALEQRDGTINVIELVRLPRSQDGRDDGDDNGT